MKPNFKNHDLVGTIDLKKTFSKRDSTKWSYKMYKITANINDTIPSYHVDNLTERYNVAMLKKTDLTKKKSTAVMKALNFN